MSDDYPNFALEQKFVYLSKYQTSPLPVWLIQAFDWICLAFSGSGSGYGIYWVITLKYRQGDQIIWEALIPCIILGLALVVGMYLKVFSDTSERVHKESEKSEKSWYEHLIFWESSWDVFLIRLGGVIGMMLFAYGVIDDFNKSKIAEAEYKQSLSQEMKAVANTDSLLTRLNFYIGLKSNGTKDDDVDADAMIAYLRNRIKENEAKADSLRPVLRAEILTMGQTDNTAMLRFLSKGDDWLYGLLILIVVGIVAASIDSAAKTMTTFVAKKSQADHAEKTYFDSLERQVKASSELSSRPVDGNLPSEGGGGLGVNLDNPDVDRIAKKINSLWVTGKASLQDIANESQCSKSWVHQIKDAMKDAGELIEDE